MTSLILKSETHAVSIKDADLLFAQIVRSIPVVPNLRSLNRNLGYNGNNYRNKKEKRCKTCFYRCVISIYFPNNLIITMLFIE